MIKAAERTGTRNNLEEAAKRENDQTASRRRRETLAYSVAGATSRSVL